MKRWKRALSPLVALEILYNENAWDCLTQGCYSSITLLRLSKAKRTYSKGSSKCFSPILESCYRTKEYNLLDPRISHASETLFLPPRRVPIPSKALGFPSHSLPTLVADLLWAFLNFFYLSRTQLSFQVILSPKCSHLSLPLSHVSNMSAFLSNLTSSILFPLTEEMVPKVTDHFLDASFDLLKHMAQEIN